MGILTPSFPFKKRQIAAEDLKGTLNVGCVPHRFKANSAPGECAAALAAGYERVCVSAGVCAQRCRLIAQKHVWTDVSSCISARVNSGFEQLQRATVRETVLLFEASLGAEDVLVSGRRLSSRRRTCSHHFRKAFIYQLF